MDGYQRTICISRLKKHLAALSDSAQFSFLGSQQTSIHSKYNQCKCDLTCFSYRDIRSPLYSFIVRVCFETFCLPSSTSYNTKKLYLNEIPRTLCFQTPPFFEIAKFSKILSKLTFFEKFGKPSQISKVYSKKMQISKNLSMVDEDSITFRSLLSKNITAVKMSEKDSQNIITKNADERALG